jgi:hypothetical protein
MAEKLSVAVILSSFLALAAWAEVPSPSAIVTLPQPQWTELTVAQKVILAPLSDDWDAMEYNRQKKWLGITRRFASMTPEEQRRVQVQMQEWGKLTPEQRRVARENFMTANKLPTEKKQELRQKWEQYSSLPEEEKERLKQQATSKPVPRPGRAPTSPTPAGAPATTPYAPPAGNLPNPPSTTATSDPPLPPADAAAPASRAESSPESETRR